MSARQALQLIFVVSLAGVGFSGTLTWMELRPGGGAAGCTAGGDGTLLGIPVCVYGLVMYLLLAGLALLGLRGPRQAM